MFVAEYAEKFEDMEAYSSQDLYALDENGRLISYSLVFRETSNITSLIRGLRHIYSYYSNVM